MDLRSFEELKCWQECKKLRTDAKITLNSLPKEENYRLKDQMVRALRSTTNDIAEGFGRFHFQENIQFCRISRGSLHELIDHFLIALEENYISEKEFNQIKKQIDTCLKLLNGYINYLKRAKTSNS